MVYLLQGQGSAGVTESHTTRMQYLDLQFSCQRGGSETKEDLLWQLLLCRLPQFSVLVYANSSSL